MSTIDVIWESPLAVAVNKPAGLSTQAPGTAESLEQRLRRQWGREERYLAFPHRLDRVVSGVVLVALTKKAARLLSGQFASRKTEKHYVALLRGCLPTADCPHESDWLRWEDTVRKVPDQPRAVLCPPEAAGAKRATTWVRPIEYDRQGDRTRVAMRPVTGRMHQLRVQAASRGFPIVGDHLYGDPSAELAGASAAAPDAPASHSSAPRIMLHAESLVFHDPANGRRRQVHAQAPF